MATVITTIASGDQISNSRTDINNNFASLNTNKIETSVIDTDTTFLANSDAKIPSQKAVKAYVDAGGNVNADETKHGIVEEATDAEVTAGTATGGTSAKLFVSPAKLLTYLIANYALIPIFRNGSATKTLSDSSASQVIAHGLGKTPKRVRFSVLSIGSTSAAMSGTGSGSFDANSQNAIYMNIQEGGGSANADNVVSGANGIIILSGTNTTDGQYGTVSVDATNITIAWTKTGTPSGGTGTFLWEAEG